MNSNEDLFQVLKDFVPRYLSHDNQEELIKDLEENFPNSIAGKIFNQLPTDHFYQGDLLLDIPFPELSSDYKNFEINYFDACILSNTCDIATENKRLMDPFIVLAAIYPLNDYVLQLEEDGISKDRITSFLSNLRKNNITNLLHLPELKDESDNLILRESFIRFDELVSLPIDYIEKYIKKEYGTEGRIISFSNYGFYLLLFKLTVHFSRLREKVFRNN